MPQWVLLAVLSALFAAFVPILGKRGLASLDATTATALRAVVMAAFLGVLAVGRGGWRMSLPIEPSSAIWIGLSGLAGALSWLCYFSALETGPAAGVVALDAPASSSPSSSPPSSWPNISPCAPYPAPC